MITTPPPSVDIPIHADENGTIRVGGTRVTLDSVIATFQRGKTAEGIQESFPTLKLVDIYAVITYYLGHRDEVDAYIRQQREKADELRREIEAKQPQSAELRARLLARREQMKSE